MHADSPARLAPWGVALTCACTDGGGTATTRDGGPQASAAAIADGTAADARPSDAALSGAADAGRPPGCEAVAATTADPLAAHYAPHGGRAAFPVAHVARLETTLAADDLTACGDVAHTRATLDAARAAWPLSDPRWWGAPSPFGTYRALRMLDAIAERGLGRAAFTLGGEPYTRQP